jgi:hypothetical protein
MRTTAFLLALAGCGATSSSPHRVMTIAADAIDHPPDGKFVTYGGPGLQLSTELRGTVILADSSTLFIAPDDNYRHMILHGNEIEPQPGDSGYDDYVAKFPADFRAHFRPIIKLETYAVDGRGTVPDGGQPPSVVDNGAQRPVQCGDHVKVTGLYVIDYAHSMYGVYCDGSFRYSRGIYMGCYAHAEIHPYEWDKVALIQPPTTAAGQDVQETHLVGAPVYSDYYSLTWEANKLAGLGGHFVTDSVKPELSADFVVMAPPMPPSCAAGACTLGAIVDDANHYGEGTTTYTVQSDRVLFHMTASGANAADTTAYRATVNVLWVKNGPLCAIAPARRRADRGRAADPGLAAPPAAASLASIGELGGVRREERRVATKPICRGLRRHEVVHGGLNARGVGGVGGVGLGHVCGIVGGS